MAQVQCSAAQPLGYSRLKNQFQRFLVVLPLKRGSLHCIVPNYEIEKFNKWSVVKFIFHRLVRYNEDDFICENPWHITNEDLVP